MLLEEKLMKKDKLIGTLTLLSGVALTLAACGNSNSNNTSHPNFKESTPKKTIKDGGNVSVAVVLIHRLLVFLMMNCLLTIQTQK